MSYNPDQILKLKRVLVVGAGRSGLSAIQLLKKLGKEIIVTDQKSIDQIKSDYPDFNWDGISGVFGSHPVELADSVDYVIVSPGISPQIPLLQYAYRKEVPVLGELEFASLFIRKPILAVTGTNGKTTVSSWIYHTLNTLGLKAVLAGNNDTPLSQIVLNPIHYEYVVAEVSSYQLEYSYFFHPHVAVVLNLSPDHLTRHPTMEDYAREKEKIYKNQGKGDVAVINLDDDWVKKMNVPNHVERIYFSFEQREIQPCAWIKEINDNDYLCWNGSEVGQLQDLPLKGKHNWLNALAVICAVKAVYGDVFEIFDAMCRFKGVPHRLEYVGRKNDVEFFNDSKSTNVESLRVALESFQQPIILIAGGRGKGSSYEPLRELVKQKVKLLITIGEDAHKLENAFASEVRTIRAMSMEEAVELAWKYSFPGAVVLLSPACASFDMYQNFEERGKHFKQCVYRIINEEERNSA